LDGAIEIRSVTKTFGDVTAVDDLDLVVPTGSLCGFLGPNGAGKSTTIRMIMSIFFPDQGEISVLGHASAVESKDRIGYLPEERGIYRKMKVADFLAYMARLKGVDGSAAHRRAVEWLERVELPDVAKKKCEELSKGMQQKVQLAATLIHDPDLLILDEPFTGLDPVNQKLARELIHNFHRQGKTVIFSTHVLFQAEQICERIFMIHKGKKVLDDTLKGVQTRFDPRTILFEPMDANGFTLDGVAGVERVDRRRSDFEVHLQPDTDPASVMHAILDRGKVKRIELSRPSLEDVFVRLVEGARIGDTGGVEFIEHEEVGV